MADTTYHFLSYFRSGFSAAITQPDSFGAGQPALATAKVGVTVSGVAQPVTHDAVVRGPGDVIGISQRQVVRTDPIPGAVGVEPNYFAQIEFDRPDLPWMFTPAAAVGERLRPWIVLIVVDADGPAACTLRAGVPLAVLSVPAAAVNQLPDLGDSPLWAHAQAILPDGTALNDAFADGADPRLAISRLLCPRHLSPNRNYIAAVVPAFDVGRLAGLGQSVADADEAKLSPAWVPGSAVDLPVYYTWRFRTGEDADFERLARALKGRPLPAGVGTRPMDVSRPGAGLPALPEPADNADTKAITWLDGALRPIDSDTLPQRDPAAEQAFRAKLTILLDKPADFVLAGDRDPVVAPPIYGDKHALVVKVDDAAAPPWIAELNLDSRARVAAGLGTQVIQERQEDLVARAWRQLGDVLAANRLLRAAQLARSGAARLHGRLAALDAPGLMTLAYPAHQRVLGVVAAAETLSRSVAASRLPAVVVEPAFRRLARASAAPAKAAGATALTAAVVERFATQAFAAPVAGPDGSTAMRAATEVIGGARATVVLTAVGDAQPASPARLDTMIATLNRSTTALPAGDAVRALPLRADAGAVAALTSLGAAPASAVSALLGAVAAPPAQPPAPSPTHPPVPPVVVGRPGVSHPGISRPGTVGHLPAGLTAVAPAVRLSAPAAAVTGIGFNSGGPSHPISTGTVLRGGTVVLDNAAVHSIATAGTAVRQLDDASWAKLKQAAKLPAASGSADPVTDLGSRLDAFRKDPAALTALAQVADGDTGAALKLDGTAAGLATGGAATKVLAGLATGKFNAALPVVAGTHTGADDLAAAHDLVTAAAGALDRIVRIGDAPPPAPGKVLDLSSAKTGLLAKFDPEVTLPARFKARLAIGVVAGVPRRDPLDPVMACPRFDDPMWQALRDLGADWLLPGLDRVPPDTATLVRTNPGFVAAHMVGLNQEMMRELLWREYPTDQRGTAFHRFWGRLGDAPDDIGPVHLFKKQLAQDLLAGGTDEAVLLLRSEILRRYPGSIIYLSRMRPNPAGELQIDGQVMLPSFRGDLPPDVSFVGFAVTPDELRGTADPWWFVIAQPPSAPRFGLDDWTPETPDAPTRANDLAWSHMTADGHPDSPSPFAPGHAPKLQGLTIDGVTWGERAAAQAQLTYQHPVRVAIRAADLLPPTTGGVP